MVQLYRLKILALPLVVSMLFAGCKTSESARHSTNDVKSPDSPDSKLSNNADSDQTRLSTSGISLDASDEIARLLYERARQEIEGGSSSLGASEVRSLMGAESFRYQVLAMENAGERVKKVGDADTLQVQVEGTYMRTTDVYENPEGPEDACLRFTAASGLRRADGTWEVESDKAGFAIQSENVVSCE
jgi:hypothetical protein